MAPIAQSQAVRDFIRGEFAERGAQTDDFRETILIRGGMYCGRRYECGELTAVWLVETNELKLYDATGTEIELSPDHRPPVTPLGTEHKDVA